MLQGVSSHFECIEIECIERKLSVTLTLEPIVKSHCGRARTAVSGLGMLRIPPEELGDMAEENNVWATVLNMLAHVFSQWIQIR